MFLQRTELSLEFTRAQLTSRVGCAVLNELSLRLIGWLIKSKS